MLQQMPQGECPIFILSWKLSAPEQKYAVIEKKARVLQWAIEEFLYYLRGQRFEVVTNHAPLKWLLTFTLCGGIWHCNLIPSCTRRVVAMLMLPFPILGAESQTAGGGAVCDAPEPMVLVSGLPLGDQSSAPPPNKEERARPPRWRKRGTYWMMGNCWGSFSSGSGVFLCLPGPTKAGDQTMPPATAFIIRKTPKGPRGWVVVERRDVMPI